MGFDIFIVKPHYMKNRNLNWKRQPEDNRDFITKRPLKVEHLTLPIDYKLPLEIPTYDQGHLGSCHDDKTEVLTENGWILFSEATMKNKFVTVNPITNELIFENPIRIIKQEYKGTMVCADRMGLNFKVTPNHKMLVRKWDQSLKTLSDNYEFVDAGKLGWYCGLMNRIIWNGEEIDLFELSAIPNAKRKKDRLPSFIPMSLWMKFIGLFLAEGTALKERNKIQIAACKEREKEYTRKLLSDIGIHALELKDRFTFTSKSIHNTIIELGLFGKRAPQKFVPQFIFKQSSNNIKLFLEGHFMGDGSKQNNLKSHYTSSNRLAIDLQRLIFLSGNESRIGIREPRTSTMKDGRKVIGKHNEHRISMCEKKNLSIERKKDIFYENYEGFVYCAEVPTYHTLVTRRNNTILIAGNCTANSGGACFRFESAQVLGNFSFDPSRLFLYYTTRLLEGTTSQDAGAYIRDVFKALNKTGVSTETSWPYIESHYTQNPPPNAYSEGLKNIAVTYAAVPQNATSIKQTLLNGGAISFGFDVFSSFQGSWEHTGGVMPIPIAGEQLLGGHAVTIIGWDDTKFGSTHYLIQNSWGTAWGNGGKFWMPEAFLLGSHCSDFWVIESISQTSPTPTPTPVPTPTPTPVSGSIVFAKEVFQTSSELSALRKTSIVRLGNLLGLNVTSKMNFATISAMIRQLLGIN